MASTRTDLCAVGPEVVVGEPSEAGLDAAYDKGDVLPGLPGPVAVDHRRPLGLPPGLAAGGVGVVTAGFFRRREVGEHGVQVARRDQGAQAGPAEGQEVLQAPPVGLGDHADPVAPGLEDPGYDGVGETGVVDIGVAGDEDEVHLAPDEAIQILPVDGKEARATACHGPSPPRRARAEGAAGPGQFLEPFFLAKAG